MEEIRYRWKNDSITDFKIEIVEDGDGFSAYRDKDGKWTWRSGNCISKNAAKDMEKCYQMHKREKKLKRICHG